MTQAIGIHQYLVLAHVAALRIDFSDAGDRTQHGPHHPILDDPALREFVNAERAIAVPGFVQGVLIDLAQTGADRPQHRHDAIWHAIAHFEQSLHHQLAREVDVRGIGEDERNQRKPWFIERAHLGQPRDSGHADFKRYGNESLDLLGRTSGRIGRDLDLDVGDIRKRVNGQFASRLKTKGQQNHCAKNDNKALIQRTAYQGRNHWSSCLRRSLFRWNAPLTTIF